MVDKASKTFAINRDDELVKATMLTDGGAVVHPAFAKAAAPEQPHVEPAAIPAKTLVADASPAKAKAKKPAAAKKPSAKSTKGSA
jgi:NAD(P) transhydrogenase subunit alpha